MSLLKASHANFETGAMPSPNDSRNGSMRRALTALLESWVNDSRDGRFCRIALATPQGAVRRWRAAKTSARNGSGVPCSILVLVVATASQASRNTYLTRTHQGSTGSTAETLYGTNGTLFKKGSESCETNDHLSRRRSPVWQRRFNKSRAWIASRVFALTSTTRTRPCVI